MRLARGQRRALEAVCETFVPGSVELGVPHVFLDVFVAAQREGERQRLRLLLSLLARSRFPRLPAARRERTLLGWCDSRSSLRRSAFQALRKGVAVAAYTQPALHARIGYPGARGAPGGERALAPLPVDGDVELDCDVCVVGSGAGGATAAAVLAAAGLDVVVLEAGGHYEEADFDGAELDGLRRLYLDRGSTATRDQGVAILAGACVGGGTVVNYTTSFRTPDEIREEWGAPFDDGSFDDALAAVSDRLGVTTGESRPSAREEKVKLGLERLGWHVAAVPRNVRGCDQGAVCGYCGYGCPLGAKQSALRTWLLDAQAAGVRLLARTRAERVVVTGGEARGVEARTSDGHAVSVRARAVVAACGALHTPALLRRSRVGNEHVGRNLHLHPVAGAFGIFDEEIRPWEGTLQAVYSDQLPRVKLETTALHPGLLAAAAPWRGARDHAELMAALPRAVPIGALLRDRDAGEVRVGRDGEPIVHYRLSPFDTGHLRAGIEGAARVLAAAGARRIVSSHARLVSFEPRRGGSVESFVRAADECGYGPGRCVLYSFHQMGSARMGGSRASSACNLHGEVWDVGRLVVCDASAFPSASGVNPMVTIEAIAYLNASALAAALP